MGKRIIQQRRGKGSGTYKANSHRWKGEISYPSVNTTKANIKEIVNCKGHTAPLVKLEDENGDLTYNVAVEGIRSGEQVSFDSEEPEIGNVLKLEDIPEGTLICNIESQPGDGGQFVRASGTFAKVVSKESDDEVKVRLPSDQEKTFNPNCRATIGKVAGGGRKEKPFLKSGKKFKAMKARNKLWPRTSGVAMNSVDHPFGSTRRNMGKQKIAPKDAPPGRKVGLVKPKQTGKKED